MTTILSLQPKAQHIGYAVFEGAVLVDWGNKHLPGVAIEERTSRRAVPVVRTLIQVHEPQVLVLPEESTQFPCLALAAATFGAHSAHSSRYRNQTKGGSWKLLLGGSRSLVVHYQARAGRGDLRTITSLCSMPSRMPLPGLTIMANNIERKYWKTGDVYLAAFLFARGVPVIGIAPYHRTIGFSFIDSRDRQTWYEEYKSGKPLVDARIYAVALSTLERHAARALLNSNYDG
jgi:hypothetical protein